MTGASRIAQDAFFEAFHRVGFNRGERRCEATESASCQGEKQSESGHCAVYRNRVDTRHRIRQNAQCDADGGCSECQTNEAPGHSEQESFRYGLANNSSGSRAERKPNGVFIATPDGSEQHESGHIRTSNKEDNGNSKEQLSE